jgi:3-oxoacyl-[acyl-carrier-protein] synthase III
MSPTVSRHTRITGTGSHLPPRRVSNAELVHQLAERGIETSDAWIVERTGIRARHFAADGVACSDLALPAAHAALQAAGRDAADVDLIIVATSTPDMVFPSTAAILQAKLGITNGSAAFDLQAVCSGFIYALSVADSLIRTGAARTALVIGSEVFSRILDFDEPGLLATELHADGRHVGILCTPGTVAGGKVSGDPTLKMDGQAVFKLAVGVLDSVARAVLAKAGKTEADVDFLIPHQANIRIMQSTARKLKLDADKVIVTVDEHGNTSAASIPLALDVAVRSGRIRRGHRLLLEGVGGGFTWGAALVEY